jgi:hypothetical protein
MVKGKGGRMDDRLYEALQAGEVSLEEYDGLVRGRQMRIDNMRFQELCAKGYQPNEARRLIDEDPFD